MRNTEALLIGIILLAGTLPALNLPFLYGHPGIVKGAEYVQHGMVILLGAFYMKAYRGKEYNVVVICFMASALMGLGEFLGGIQVVLYLLGTAFKLLGMTVFGILILIRALRDENRLSWQNLVHYALSLVLVFQAAMQIYFMQLQGGTEDISWLPKINIAVMGLISLIKFYEKPVGAKENYEAALLNLIFVYAYLGLIPVMSN